MSLYRYRPSRMCLRRWLNIDVLVGFLCVYSGVPPTAAHPLPRISHIMFLIFPQHCDWPRAARTTRKRSQFKSSQMENMENRSAGHPHTLPPSPLLLLFSSFFRNAASCHSLTDKLTFCRGPCPFQSEFIEGDFDLLHEATAVAVPSVTLIAWWTLGGECYGS